jgi:ERCC4-type nuclease
MIEEEEEKKEEKEEEVEVEVAPTPPSTITLIIDNRENKLIEEINKLRTSHLSFQKICVETKNLDLGDVNIKVNHHDILIERKSVDDLLASIKDGRYEEQSFRLQSVKDQQHIYYVIEGKVKSQQQTVYSSILSLNYFKGFSVLKTQDVKETAEMLLYFCVKLEKEKNKKKKEDTEASTSISYTSVMKKKSDNITQQNFGEIVLCQIPTVNHTFAKVIMEHYDRNLLKLIDALKENRKCLDDLTYTVNQKKRKINKNCIANILNFLVPTTLL